MLEPKNTLMKGELKIEKMKDLNMETRVEGPLINAVEFHPTSTVALVAGQAGVASIIQVFIMKINAFAYEIRIRFDFFVFF